MTQIAIIGTGRMARALGKRWAEVGNTIAIGSRDPASKADFAREVMGASLSKPATAIDGAEVVVLALPFAHVEGFAREHASALRKVVVVDVSNPFSNLPDNRISAAEITAKAIGDGARVVAAFKDNFWETLVEPSDESVVMRDVHFAGDDADAMLVVSRLIDDLGFRPIDCGSLKNARALDAMVPLLLELDKRYAGAERRSSWKFLGEKTKYD